MNTTAARQYEGLSANASDLVKIVAWAQEDPQLLTRVYLRYPRAKRITEAMVCRMLHEEHHEADRRGSRSAAAAPRCAVCGGPDADGNGCEYCPAVTP